MLAVKYGVLVFCALTMITPESSSKRLLFAKLASDLKVKCLEYVDGYLNDDFLESESGRKMTEGLEEDKTGEKYLVDGKACVRHIDNYILFGMTKKGHKVLDVIINNAKLNIEEKEVLEQWRKRAFSSIFEVKEATADKIRAIDVAAEIDYEIYLSNLNMGHKAAKGMPIGSFVQTNIFPVKDMWFFSGSQQVLAKESEATIFTEFITKASARQIFRNNPEKLRIALENQKKHYKVFLETFSTDELIVPPDQVQGKLQEYYDKLSRYSSKSSNKIVAPKLPEELNGAKTIGIVMDEHEGQYEFEDYGEFVRIFETGDLSQKSIYLVMDYLENESMPAFIFRRMKDRYTKNFSKVIPNSIYLDFV